MVIAVIDSQADPTFWDIRPMMPHVPVLDTMRRTMMNLAFLERHSAEDGPFEVTQLINSFLGALAHPWETPRADLPTASLAEAGQQGGRSRNSKEVADLRRV